MAHPDQGNHLKRAFGIWRVVFAGTCLIVIYGLLHAVVMAQEIFLLGFLAVLIAIAFSFPVNLMSRRISRGWASLLTLLLFLGTLGGVTVLTVPILSRQAHQLISQAPQAYQRVEQWLSRIEKRSDLSDVPQDQSAVQTARNQMHEVVTRLLPKTLPVAANVVSALSAFLLLVILAAFLVSQPDSYRQSFSYLVPRRHEPHLNEVWRRVGVGLRHWVGGIIVSMTIMGSLTAFGLWVVGIDGWFTLGFITFLATFVPYVGAIMSSIPGLMIGLSMSISHFFYAFAVYVGVHIIEGYIVEPFVMKRAVSLRPGELLFWQALMGGLFGILGIVIATPLLVWLKVMVGYFYIEQALGKRGPEP